jgi:tetratricopeptide (TPR) repeat protein
LTPLRYDDFAKGHQNEHRWWFALAVALLLGGCGRNVDSPSQPLHPQKPPQPEGDTAAIELHQSDSPPVDPLKLQEDAMDALESGDLDAAFKFVRAAKSATPDDPQTIFLMARVLAERNRFAEAIKMLDDLAKAVPETRLPVLGQTAEWSVFQGQWQEAERRYRSLLDEVVDASMVHRLLSQLLLRQGRRLEAAAYLRKLCRVGDIEESELRSLLMTVHPFSGETAIDELEPIGALGRARYEISQGNWDAALDELDQSTSERPAEAALHGRIYAHQQNFESLAEWVSETSESGQETADYWFARGVYEAHGSDHHAAVTCFCEVVLRDQTDAEAYLLMSQSLAELEADAEAQEASKRAKLIRQTRVIGNQMAASDTRDVPAMSTLVDLLDNLHRPFEAMAWRAVQVYYGKSSSAISDQATLQFMSEINRDRVERLQAGDPDATEHFLLCGVDLDSLRSIDDADTPSNGR